MRERTLIGTVLMVLGLGVPAGAQGLVEAIRLGDREAVRAQLARNADVNAVLPDGSTALHVAINLGDDDTARLLLSAGANPTATTRYGVTPIGLAARNGNAPLIDALVRAGADPNTASKEGETALMTAVRSGSLPAVRTLLTLGANPNAKEGWHEQTALMWAAADDRAEIARALVEAGADVNARAKVLPGQPPRPRDSETSFQSAHSNFPKGGFTPLIFAAQYGAMNVADVLVGAGADLNATEPDGITPTIMAIINGHYDVAAQLVAKGADIEKGDKSGRRPLYWAVENNNIEWLFSRPDPQPSGEMDPVALVKFLLERGADPNARLTARGFPIQHDSGGNANLIGGTTPFMKAASASDVTVMRLLLEHGADPNLTTQNHTTPMMAAAGLNWADIANRGTEEATIEAMKLMLEHGADVNAFNDLGETAMHGAAQRGGDKVVQFLADQGAFLDAKNRRGRTPMDEAIGQADGGENGDVRRPERKSTIALLTQLLERQTVAQAGR